MIVDSSAVIAILWNEPEADDFLNAIVAADGCWMSALNYLETAFVMIGRGNPAAADDLDAFIARLAIEIVPLDTALVLAARAVFVRYGKGRHPAALNLGDCAAYALAKARGLPLLYKGNDFARTDLASALD